MPSNQTDTIAAIATPPGVGGIGVIRVSGPHALALADKVFRTPSGASLCDAPSHTIHYGHIVEQTGNVVDEAMAAVMRAPRTFTAEDVVELSTHGSPSVLQKTLGLLLAAGARMAQAGEFTKRAFLNGRVDLARAEAVLDVIHADSDASIKNAVSQLEGGLSRQIEQIRAPLLYTAAPVCGGGRLPGRRNRRFVGSGAARYADGGGFPRAIRCLQVRTAGVLQRKGCGAFLPASQTSENRRCSMLSHSLSVQS